MVPCKVLSTRRLDPSLVDQAKKSGVELTQQDFISITPIISNELAQEIKPWIEKNDTTYAIFTSINGVEAVKYYLEQWGDTNTPDWKVFCISGKTREAVTVTLPGAPIMATAEYGATLAQYILQHSEVKEVLFFCGNKRREELPSLLREAGITVHEIVVYQTEETPVVIQEDVDGVLFFSPSAVNSFFSTNELKKDTVCFAIGTTTTDALAQHTTNKIITAATTSQASMLEAVQHYFQRINCNE
jgi:uroporphyrinogen-III synthase